jgi:2',3'-cyclic-nucleotide 2'-phosphodiesterase
MNILFIGDIFGRPGRRVVAKALPALKEEFSIDITVANGENAAGGLGATPENLDELLAAGVQAFTFGNHTWNKRVLVDAIDKYATVVRPANYKPHAPGRGSALIEARGGQRLGIVNLLGRVYMEPVECPFDTADREIEALRAETPHILVDMHAEATAEKAALGWHLDGRCSAVVGTHTHVQTADERVLPGGTAYITDVGMTGPQDSVIGVEKELAIGKFVTGMPAKWEVATGRAGICAVVIETDDETGRARRIERVMRDVALT